jgi:hypothetical protein
VLLVGDQLSGAFEDDGFCLAGEVYCDSGIRLEVAHPAGLVGAAEAECAIDPNAVDGTDVRATVRAHGGHPVVRRGAELFFDVGPGDEGGVAWVAVFGGEAGFVGGGLRHVGSILRRRARRRRYVVAPLVLRVPQDKRNEA